MVRTKGMLIREHVLLGIIMVTVNICSCVCMPTSAWCSSHIFKCQCSQEMWENSVNTLWEAKAVFRTMDSSQWVSVWKTVQRSNGFSFASQNVSLAIWLSRSYSDTNVCTVRTIYHSTLTCFAYPMRPSHKPETDHFCFSDLKMIKDV